MIKTAIITGASKGIGAVIAKRLNELNYNLVLNYRTNTALMEELIVNFKNKETKNIIVQCDVSLYEDAKKLIDEAYSTFGTVDVLINNAGITKDNLLPLMTEEEFDRVIDINLKGTFNSCRHIAKKDDEAKAGEDYQHIIGVRPCGQSGPGQLFRFKGRHNRHDKVHGKRIGEEEHFSQCHSTGIY